MRVSLKSAPGGKAFVGIKYVHNDIEFFYPEAYHWNNPQGRNISSPMDTQVVDIEKEFSADIQSLLAIIITAKQSDKITQTNATPLADESFALSSYIWLIRNYIANGIYINREFLYKRNQHGKINWKRTMRLRPTIVKNSVFYQDYIAGVKSNCDNLIVEIYRHCLRKSIFFAGWLYNIRRAALGIESLQDIELTTGEICQYTNALNNELRNTFDDGKRELLQHLLNIISGLNTPKNNELVYGVESFDHCFQTLVDTVFGNRSVSDFYPKAVWYLNGQSYSSSSLQPDTIMVLDNACVIIDAKCYRYAFLGGGRCRPRK